MISRHFVRVATDRRWPCILATLAALTLAGGRASAQAFPFLIQYQQGTTVAAVGNGGSVTVAATGIGQTAQAALTLVYEGTSTATLSVPVMLGSGDFSAGGTGTSLTHGQSVVVPIQFKPSTAAAQGAQLTISYTDGAVSGSVLIGLVGTTPNLTVSYSLPTNQNSLPLAQGGTLQFGPTVVNSTITATVVITNSGSGSGTVSDISVSGSAFQLVGKPVTPLTVAAGASIPFGVKYSPTQVASDTGGLTIGITAAPLTVTLAGSGITATLTTSYILPTDQNSVPLPSGSTLQFPDTFVNTTITASVVITNSATSPGTVTDISASGTAFQLLGRPAFPLTIPAGTSFAFGVKYAPTKVGSDTGTLSISLSGSTVAVTLAGNGTTPTLTVSYVLPTDQNAVSLSSGGTLQFPGTTVNTSLTAEVVITNSATGPGTVSAISATGTPFQLLGLPAFPLTIAAGTSFAFGVRYTPTQIGSDSGTLTIGLASGVLTATLAGTGVTSSFSYAIVTASGDVPFAPNQPVSFADTNVNSTSSLTIKVLNSGAAAGSVAAIVASGGPFTVTDSPFLPATLNPNSFLQFTVTFSPVQAGKVTGKLRVNNDTFDLTGTGLGPKLDFSYGSGTALQTGGTLVFSPLQVGQTAQISFTVTNDGTTAANVASIAVGDTHAIFSVTNLPPLPLSLAPGAAASFNVVFTPATTGPVSSVLLIDTQSFNLTGVGTQPPPIPTFQFTGPTGNVSPQTQPAIGLTLNAPYTLPLTGVLTITMNSSAFTPDASVLFANGGRTVTFTIPANSTQAVFPAGGSQIQLQTGTTAGTITISPTFATQSGLDLTPTSPPALTLNVPASAPTLLKIQITNVSQAAFAIGVTGYSTTRSLSTLTFLFTPPGGGSPAKYVLDVAAEAGLWFNSSASQNFGGQFSASVPFAIPNPSATALATSVFQSVSVTATNGQGTSGPVTLSVQ